MALFKRELHTNSHMPMPVRTLSKLTLRLLPSIRRWQLFLKSVLAVTFLTLTLQALFEGTCKFFLFSCLEPNIDSTCLLKVLLTQCTHFCQRKVLTKVRYTCNLCKGKISAQTTSNFGLIRHLKSNHAQEARFKWRTIQNATPT